MFHKATAGLKMLQRSSSGPRQNNRASEQDLRSREAYLAGAFVSGVAGAASSAFLQPTNARQTANTNKESAFIFEFINYLFFLPCLGNVASASAIY